MARERLDKLLLDRGLVASPERARALIMTGDVLVRGQPETKPGTMLDPAAEIRLRAEDHPYVSRGALKLVKGLDQFAIDPSGLVALDIGASTGGPQAFQTILSQLPVRFPLPILCVQHISSGFLAGLVNWLGAHYKGKVQIAVPGETPLPGRVYFPTEETHLIIDRNGRLQASREPARGGHRPSVNITFESVAEHYGETAIGVLLTGMGHDGGEGMQRLAQAGALTIAQDEASCVIYGMPKAAVERGAAQMVLPLDEIARTLTEAVTSR